MPQTKEPLTLYLAPWQKNMVRDFMSSRDLKNKPISEISKITIKYKLGRCPSSYKIPEKGMVKGDWIMYLSEEQIARVQAFTGSKVRINSVNISPSFLEKGEVVFE